jgi:hypothetical protein
MSAPDEGYSGNAPCTPNSISTLYFYFIKTKDHSPQAGVTLANDGRSGPIKVSLPQNTPIEVPVTS